jgi:glycosyltransferase involved in cell wall biosynthesis
MISKPRVSIVIPTFNRATMVKETIDSALAQTLPCEVVVVDHGSRDETPRVVAEYGDRIVYIRRDVDDGPCIAWFDGVLRSSGEYIHINYDDDWIAPSFVERAMASFADDISLVFTNGKVVRGLEEKILLDPSHFVGGTHDAWNLLRYLIECQSTISPGCAVFRRKDALDALLINPPFRSNLYRGVGPDLMMFLVSLARYPRYAFVDEPLAVFRAHDQSITINASLDAAKAQRLISAYDEYKLFFLLGLSSDKFAGYRISKSLQFVWRQIKRFKLFGIK